MRTLSLRARLLAGVGAVVVVLVTVAIVITTTTRSQLVAQTDARLASAVVGDRGGGSLDVEGRGDHREPPDDAPPDAPPERRSDFYEGRISPGGELVTVNVPNVGRSSYEPPDVDADDIAFDRSGSSYFTASEEDGDGVYRVLAVVAADGDGAVIVALPFDDVESTIRELVLIEVAAVLAILAVLGLVTWWMLRLGIAPIKRMTETATTIAAGDLSARADESASAAESRELAVALNTMMGTIEEALDERAASEQRLRRFVSDASHELRTPVTTIRGYAELYRAGGLGHPDDLADAMRRTEQEATRMARLVEDMLTLAKLDEHRPIARQSVDLAKLARDAGADARAVAPGRPIEVEAPDPVMVVGDEDRLRQVIANIVNNSLAHTDGEVPVSITARDVDGRAVLEVADRGDGMPPDVAGRVTERFFRADPSRSRDRGGSGLGLAIVESTVAAHDGTVEIRSAPGAGTTVVVSLPLATS